MNLSLADLARIVGAPLTTVRSWVARHTLALEAADGVVALSARDLAAVNLLKLLYARGLRGADIAVLWRVVADAYAERDRLSAGGEPKEVWFLHLPAEQVLSYAVLHHGSAPQFAPGVEAFDLSAAEAKFEKLCAAAEAIDEFVGPAGAKQLAQPPALPAESI